MFGYQRTASKRIPDRGAIGTEAGDVIFLTQRLLDDWALSG